MHLTPWSQRCLKHQPPTPATCLEHGITCTNLPGAAPPETVAAECGWLCGQGLVGDGCITWQGAGSLLGAQRATWDTPKASPSPWLCRSPAAASRGRGWGCHS